jgi:regulator of sigma E protease
MLVAILCLIGISLLIFVHELGHFISARQAGIRVEEFGFGFPPRAFGIKRGDTLYSINWLPFGGFVKIYGENKHRTEEMAKVSGEKIDLERAFFYQSAWKRFVVICAGISINFIAGWLLLSFVYMVGDAPRVVISDLQAGSPAVLVGLKINDKLVDFKDSESFVTYTKANKGNTIDLKINRDGVENSVSVKLRDSVSVGEGALGAAVSDVGFAKLSPYKALLSAFSDSVKMVADIFVSLGGLVASIFTDGKLPSNIVGPIGVFGIAGDLAKLGFIYVVQLIATISLNLAALNALPIPALDGGRALFILIEKVKGSPIKPKQELIVNAISFSALILLMLAITGRDIFRLF